MASLLDKLRNERGTSVAKLQEQIKQKEGGFVQDERIYRPRLDKQKGKNTVKLRFLPSQFDDCPAFVELKEFSFKGKNGRYWQKSRATLIDEETGRSLPDPALIARINAFKKRKTTGDESYYEIGKSIRENRKFYYNVLIIEDKLQPDMEGQVKILQCGPQIATIVENAISPEFPTVEPINPFDLWDGHDFNINIGTRSVGSETMPTYEKSAFDAMPRELGDDAEKEEIIKQTYDIREFIAPESFKSFDELAAEFKRVWGLPHDWLSDTYTEDHAEAINRASAKPAVQSTPEPAPEEDEAPWDDSDADEAPAAPVKTANSHTERLAQIRRNRSKGL